MSFPPHELVIGHLYAVAAIVVPDVHPPPHAESHQRVEAARDTVLRRMTIVDALLTVLEE